MKKNQSILSFSNGLLLDKDRKKCLDKVVTVSLVHNTGHITVITKSGRQYKTTLANLISELKTDQSNDIVKSQSTIFENFITFRYTEARETEFNKIKEKAKLNFIDIIEQPDIYKHTNSFVVTMQVDNINLDLAEFIQEKQGSIKK